MSTLVRLVPAIRLTNVPAGITLFNVIAGEKEGAPPVAFAITDVMICML